MVPARILVVEDEVIVARTIASQLTQFGYTVVDTASSGATAIAKATQHKPDLVLMDIVLKGEMDGVTAASQICSDLDVPIIFLTAYADDKTLQRVKQTLPLGYIVKPFSPGELRVAVELALFKHQMEQELRANREYLATLLHSMNDAVIATDEQGQITFMNPAAQTLTGWREIDAFGKPAHEVLQLVDEVTELPAEDPVSQVLASHQVVQLKDFTALTNRNGDRIPIGDSASPIRQAGAVSGVVMVFWDMSAHRQSLLLNRALEKEQELNQLKSQFIATVSHEFRNPLAAIRMAVELLDRQGTQMPEAKMKEYLQRIGRSVQHMNQLIDDVLLMGRVESGYLTCVLAPVDLRQLCQTVLEECAIALSPTHQLLLDYPDNSPAVMLDETLIHAILSNLITNAIKYSPSGGVIRVSVSYEPDFAQVILQVQDEGIGIPASEQAQLFEPFFRASNARSMQGSGMGLAIVKRCIELHQGQVEVISQLGQGTTIRIKLPMQ